MGKVLEEQIQFQIGNKSYQIGQFEEVTINVGIFFFFFFGLLMKIVTLFFLSNFLLLC